MSRVHKFSDAHYFLLPTQSNIYGFTELCMSEGVNKFLVASLKRKVYLFDYAAQSGFLKPSVKEVPFTYIPSGAEIISIDAFNKSYSTNDFVIGITITKVPELRTPVNSSEPPVEAYLNIYSDWEPNEDFNLDVVAQSCLSLELQYTPYQLYHTSLPETSEIAWLLSGSDLQIHMYREDRLNHCYQESEISTYFPELKNLTSVAIWMDMTYSCTKDTSYRLTALGCEDGAVILKIVDITSLTVLLSHERTFDGPMSSVRFFRLNSGLRKETLEQPTDDSIAWINDVHLLVTNALQPSAVYMNVTKNGLERFCGLPETVRYDAAICSCIADVDMDGQEELVIGTHGQAFLIYKYLAEKGWKLSSVKNLSNPIHALSYLDITGDGMCELVAVTLKGIHILQHNLDTVKKLLTDRVEDESKL